MFYEFWGVRDFVEQIIKVVGSFFQEMVLLVELCVYFGVYGFFKSFFIIDNFFFMVDFCLSLLFFWLYRFQSVFRRVILNFLFINLEFCFDFRIWYLQMNLDYYFQKIFVDCVSRFLEVIKCYGINCGIVMLWNGSDYLDMCVIVSF